MSAPAVLSDAEVGDKMLDRAHKALDCPYDDLTISHRAANLCRSIQREAREEAMAIVFAHSEHGDSCADAIYEEIRALVNGAQSTKEKHE